MKQLLFYYPKHFNRSKYGTNPFFDKMLDVCDRYGITYDLMEEPDTGTDKPHNPKAKKADIFFWTVTALRKIVAKLRPQSDFYEREKTVARLFNLISFGRYRYRNYITISGSMYHLFSILNPDATVYDMQHGVLFKHHPTFFDQTTLKLRRQYYPQNLQMLFWGKGYHDCFVKGEENVMTGKAHILGYPIESVICAEDNNPSESRQIVVSLQFTHDVCMEELRNMKQTLCQFLESTESLGVRVLLKNHPRYNDSIEIDDIFNRFKHAELTDKRLEELAPYTLLHVTYFSTTAFEYAQYGVPTFFLPYERKELKDTLYYDEYNYPLYLDMDAVDVIKRLYNSDNYREDAIAVKIWYRNFYSLFDEQKFLELMKK